MLNLNQLYYFFVTARAGGVTVAAKQLRISQPSLSAQIKTLENSIGKRLFDRSGRRLQLSKEGEQIYGQCRKIFEAAESLEKSLKGASEAKRLHLGVSSEIERPFLVEIIGKIHRAKSTLPAPLISMTSESHEALLSRLRTRVYDAIIVNEPVFDPELSMLASARMPVVLAFKADGRFKKLRSISPGTLRQASRELELPWALPARGMRLRRESDQFFERARIEAPPAFESDVLAAVARAVADDVGVALLPLPYIEAYAKQQSLTWISPTKGFWSHSIWLVTRRAEGRADSKTDSDSARLDELKHAFKAVLSSKAGVTGP